MPGPLTEIILTDGRLQLWSIRTNFGANRTEILSWSVRIAAQQREKSKWVKTPLFMGRSRVQIRPLAI